MEKIELEDGGVSYVHLTEMPDGSIRIEGIRQSEADSSVYSIISIRLSRRAITKLIPMLQEIMSE